MGKKMKAATGETPLAAAIYARVSTADQHCEMQLTELREYAARTRWKAAEYVEYASGKAGSKRPELERLMEAARLRKVDVVLVWKLDRFGRSVQEFLDRVVRLDQSGVRFIAGDAGDRHGQELAGGAVVDAHPGRVAEFEREIIKERSRAGIAEAKRQGKHCGRPRKVFRRDQAVLLRKGGMSWRKIASMLGVPQATIRAAVAAER
jgi:DNA invertase Pin-like site-specific DNA recombinase